MRFRQTDPYKQNNFESKKFGCTVILDYYKQYGCWYFYLLKNPAGFSFNSLQAGITFSELEEAKIGVEKWFNDNKERFKHGNTT